MALLDGNSIGDEVGYRTIYAALCSQAHSDPEDIVNNMVARVIPVLEPSGEAQQVEQYHFSFFMLHHAVAYHLRAAIEMFRLFGIATEELQRRSERIEKSGVAAFKIGQQAIQTAVAALDT